MARRPTRTPARKDDYEDHGPPILLWSASAVLFILTALPYLLGNALIELEVLAAQPFLRLILLVLAVAVAALAILRKEIPIAILPSLAALLIIGETFSTMGTSPAAQAPPDRAGYLHVYTQNIGMESPEEFIGLLASGDFDVVLMQEAYLGHRKGWEVLAKQLGYHIYFQVLRRDAGMACLVMSKTPIQILPAVRALSWARQIRYFPRVRINYEKVPVDLYTVHLESLPLVQGGRVLFGSSKLRLQQSEILAREIAATNHPVILGGDLNSTPIYRSNRPLRDLLNDAWTEAGFGFGYTYHASLPFARIDAVLHKGFRTVSAEVIKVSNSDHRGLHVVLESAR
jgi:vancomycin resistance protein VanJ